jgi:uncharacterized protein
MGIGKELSRRRFLSHVAGSAAASLVARPAFSFSASHPASSGASFDVASTDASIPPRQDQGVIATSNSPYAKLHSIPVRAVTVREGFWSKRRQTNVEHSIPSMHDELEAHGRMDHFRRLVAKSSAPQKGPYFSDSDVYKWIDAAGWALQSDPNTSSVAPRMPGFARL